jgi:uncharacterized protein
MYQIKQSTIQGSGLFAQEKIPKGQRIIEYLGEKITKEESKARLDQDNNYIFELDGNFDIDGNVPYNPARFINHSCDPNCYIEKSDGKIWVVASRDIEESEELSFNYGFDIHDYQSYPCKCGAKNCIGYMLDQDLWHKVKNHESHC